MAKVLASRHATFIKMPSKAEAINIANEMFQKYGIHGVIGAVDGTHLHISKPLSSGPVLPERFFNRKGYYSINCMGVCDNQNRIRYWTNRHAGSAHDARIYSESHLKVILESQYEAECPLYLLGNSNFSFLDVTKLTLLLKLYIVKSQFY